MAGAFVGRRDELGVLEDALADATAGQPGTAHATATRLGAVPLQRDVERLGRRVGRQFGRRSACSDGVLTPREQDVLELVVAGASNPEIGEALHISRKTASVHVSNILRKLEVASRTEAAAVAVRDGLVGAGRPPRAP